MSPSPMRHLSQDHGLWYDQLDAHAERHGFHAYLSPRHGALFTEDDRTLLVSFEEAGAIRARPQSLPYGLEPAGRSGWSHLCLYSEGDTWFRDPEVYALFDDLVDDGFFDRFDRVLFYGAGPGGYAAAAFSVAAPGAEVLALRPQATLDPAVTGWDDRHLDARRWDFASRYGYAPAMIRAAGQVSVVVDPRVRLDAMHAALFTQPNAQVLRADFMGPLLERELEAMGVLTPMVQAAAQGALNRARFAALYRKRQRHPAYLRGVLDHLEASDRPLRVARWCQAVLRFSGRTRFQSGLARARETLRAQGRALPVRDQL